MGGEPLELECVIPIQGVNWPVPVPVTATWDHFKATIAHKLGTSTDEIQLSYRFSSFTATENAEVLCSQDHFQNMISKAMVFLSGRRKVRGGKDFRVFLSPAFKQPLPAASEASTLKKGPEKVSFHVCNVSIKE
jgi:hypothetical protein